MTNVVVTAYCACTLCCGQHADGFTASGTRPVEGRTIACNWLPFGTIVRIEGFRVPKVVEDRMARRFSDRVDIYFKSHAAAKRFGKRNLKITVLKHSSPTTLGQRPERTD